MAATAYCTAAMIRELEKEVFEDTTEFPSDTLLTYAQNWADPVIDARMNAAGYTTPFETGSEPAVIKMLSAMIGCAYLLQSALVKYSARNVERARTLLDDADKMMTKIQAGKMTLDTSSQSTAGAAIYIDPDPEERPAASVFTGSPEYWSMPTETRET